MIPDMRVGGFRVREIACADGSRLQMRADGSSHHASVDGTVARSWTPQDPGWPALAIRSSGRTVGPLKPPGW